MHWSLVYKRTGSANYRAKLETVRNLFHPHHQSHPPWSSPRHQGLWQHCSCQPCPPNSPPPPPPPASQPLVQGGRPAWAQVPPEQEQEQQAVGLSRLQAARRG